MYVFIVKMYQSLLVFRHFYVLISAPTQLDVYRVTELGQHSLDSTLSLHQHVMNVCRVAYLELRHINSIQNLLSADAANSSMFTCVVSS